MSASPEIRPSTLKNADCPIEDWARDTDRDRIFSETQIQSHFLSLAVSTNRNQSAGFFPFEMMTCISNTRSLALFSNHDLSQF